MLVAALIMALAEDQTACTAFTQQQIYLVQLGDSSVNNI